ncbi:MAG TPA: class I tRNA ligase family protein, partial [Spirochaetia bacterium]|nr:class I tRNA ligase family protein [Spirochaetia bacterium]
FTDIIITGLVRDKHGRKMSKSLGNGVDPLELIDEYGADSLKFTMAFLAAQGQDVLLDKESVKLGSRFANKIWNASRYLLMNLEGRTLQDRAAVALTDTDRWILHRLNAAVSTARSALEGYRFNEASQAIYEFIWNDFCDWYIEAAKLSLNADEAEKDRIVTLLLSLLEESLRLAHPFLPLITEEIYQTLPQHGLRIMSQPYPSVDASREAPEAAARFGLLQEVVRAVRTIRAEFTVPPDARVAVTVVPDAEARRTIEAGSTLVRHLAGIGTLAMAGGRPTGKGVIAAAGRGFEVFVELAGSIDAPKEIARLGKDREKAQAEIGRTKEKLSKASFVERAPKEVVDREKEKLVDLDRLIQKIDGYVKALSA